MTSDKIRREDEILAAIFRVWETPERRIDECTRFAHDRRFITTPGKVYPMTLASVLADQGWTERNFLYAIS